MAPSEHKGVASEHVALRGTQNMTKQYTVHSPRGRVLEARLEERQWATAVLRKWERQPLWDTSRKWPSLNLHALIAANIQCVNIDKTMILELIMVNHYTIGMQSMIWPGMMYICRTQRV